MQPNVPNKMPANTFAPQDQYNSDEKISMPAQGYQPAFPAQQMPANTVAPQDHHNPEKEKKKKKGRLRRAVKGYLLMAGVIFTFAIIAYLVLVLLEKFFPLT